MSGAWSTSAVEMASAQTARLNNIVWNLHEQRARNVELIELRRRYLERAYCAQIKV